MKLNMKKMLNIKVSIRNLAMGLGSVGVLIALTAAGCQSTSASGNSAESATSRQDLNTYEQNQPAPHFPHSDIRSTATEAEASQALGEQTTSFFFNQGSQTPIFECPSSGDPVPFSTQITNPQQVITHTGPNGNKYVPGDATATIGNIDPNGVYLPDAAEGTNVMCLNSAGQRYLVYWEGFVWTVNGNATWSGPGTPPIKVTGGIQMPTCKVELIKGKNQTICTK